MSSRKIEIARSRVLLRNGFFATLLLCTPEVETTAVGTAAVDDKTLYVNPEFIDSLDDIGSVMYVLVHEVLHQALGHVWRLGERDPKLWNIATDYVINLMLHEAGFDRPKVKGQPIGLFDHGYANMSADQVYSILAKQPQKNQAQPGWGQKDGDGDMRRPSDMSPAARAKAELDARQLLQQAAFAAGQHVPDSIKRLMEDMKAPHLPWQDLLRDYMLATAQEDETWSRRNRRYTDMYLPSYHSERAGEIVFIGDTSGSIGGPELAKVAAEVAYCAAQLNPERVRVLWADTRVRAEQVFEEGEPIVCKPEGGGGTDMRVPLKHAEQYDPSVVILMTDGATPWPTTETSYPLIVCCTTNTNVPIGRVVRVTS